MSVKRGEIYYADLSPVVGSEQGGVRPVLIVQNDVGNLYSPTVIVAAITTSDGKAEIPTHISIERTENGLKKDSMALLEQVRTIDRSRLQEYIGHLGMQPMNRVNNALAISLGLHFLRKGRKSQMDEGQRGWIYCRANKTENSEGHLEMQEKRLLEYARMNGIEVVGISTDVCSGLSIERTGLDEVMEAATARKMDVLLVLAVSHIGRDVIPTLEHMRKLLDCGVGVESVKEGIIDFVPFLDHPILTLSQR